MNTMTNLLRVNPNTKHLNEMAHRHSFNESIYSEPYGGRYLSGNNRLETNHPNPLCESASASNIYTGNNILTAQRTHPQFFFPQNHLSHRDVYATTSSVAINGLSTEVSSTRSSVYSDKTILNETTPPSTPRLSSGANNEQTTIKVTNPNKSTASNASGSQSNTTQSKLIYTTTEVLTQQTSSNNVDNSTHVQTTESINTEEQSKKP